MKERGVAIEKWAHDHVSHLYAVLDSLTIRTIGSEEKYDGRRREVYELLKSIGPRVYTEEEEAGREELEALFRAHGLKV